MQDEQHSTEGTLRVGLGETGRRSRVLATLVDRLGEMIEHLGTVGQHRGVCAERVDDQDAPQAGILVDEEQQLLDAAANRRLPAGLRIVGRHDPRGDPLQRLVERHGDRLLTGKRLPGPGVIRH